jgi:Cytochrome c554 and c-prime
MHDRSSSMQARRTRIACDGQGGAPHSIHARFVAWRIVAAAAIAGAALAVAGCARQGVDRQALLDPVACASCHPDAYKEWAASSHAYASDDPIFRATLQRGQRETGGALGTFCVGCHAPMSARTGSTTDGLDLDSLPQELHGITCYFCHEAEAVEGDHNDPIVLANDDVMRGGFDDPVRTPAHGSAHTDLLDSRATAASDMCGSCHDVVANDIRIERTYAEWQASVFATPGPTGVGCGGCHMMGRDGVSSTGDGMPARRLHDHTFPGLDQARGPWPDGDMLQAAIERDLEPTVLAKLCVQPGGGALDVGVTLDNVLAGHAWPSGVTHARRAWVELVARQAGTPIYQSGVVPDGGDPAELDDPDLWLMRQRLLDADGNEVAMPWQARQLGITELPAAVTSDPTDPRYYHAVTHRYPIPATADEIELHLRVTAMGTGVLHELEDSGDLEPGLEPLVPIYDVTTATRVWHASDGYSCQ